MLGEMGAVGLLSAADVQLRLSYLDQVRRQFFIFFKFFFGSRMIEDVQAWSMRAFTDLYVSFSRTFSDTEDTTCGMADAVAAGSLISIGPVPWFWCGSACACWALPCACEHGSSWTETRFFWWVSKQRSTVGNGWKTGHNVNVLQEKQVDHQAATPSHIDTWQPGLLYLVGSQICRTRSLTRALQVPTQRPGAHPGLAGGP